MEEKVDFILAVDGGANHCIKASVIPNLILGDLDSISKKTLKFVKSKDIIIEKFPRKKDATDTELSLDYLIEKGYRDITLMGVTGSRMDHSLGNIFLLNSLKKKNIEARIIDDNNIICLVEDNLILSRKENSFISIIPISTCGIRISLKGFEYNLDRRDVEFSSTITISNRVLDEKAIIEIHRGKALVIESRD